MGLQCYMDTQIFQYSFNVRRLSSLVVITHVISQFQFKLKFQVYVTRPKVLHLLVIMSCPLISRFNFDIWKNATQVIQNLSSPMKDFLVILLIPRMMWKTFPINENPACPSLHCEHQSTLSQAFSCRFLISYATVLKFLPQV